MLGAIAKLLLSPNKIQIINHKILSLVHMTIDRASRRDVVLALLALLRVSLTLVLFPPPIRLPKLPRLVRPLGRFLHGKSIQQQDQRINIDHLGTTFLVARIAHAKVSSSSRVKCAVVLVTITCRWCARNNVYRRVHSKIDQ
jgi:hypothetical protein